MYNSKAEKRTSLQTKVRNSLIEKELKAISKAVESDARYQQFKESQFRTKYEKYLTTGNFEQVPLHKLLYTHGEVDVDKVVCLHLLSVQHYKTLSCAQEKNLRIFPKRSKPNVLETSSLPFYILEIDHKIYLESRTFFPQGQEVVIIVNSSLEKLVTSITEVLEIVSPQKLKKIKEVLSSKKSIQEVMIKMKILNFLAQLKDNPVLLNVDGYRIEIANYTEEPGLATNVLTVSHIMVKDKSRKIEQIQREIRTKINTFTEKNVEVEESWEMLHRKYCNCGKSGSLPSLAHGRTISLLNDEGTEFARVTESGCRLPKGSSLLTNSLTAIIKSSPRERRTSIPDQGSMVPLNSLSSAIKNQEGRLIRSMLYKVKNSHRILIGKKAAELKLQHSNCDKKGKQKLPINKIIEGVFSRDSLLSFASTAENEELKMMFQPCCKGGLGMGSYLLNTKTSNTEKNRYQRQSAVCSHIDDEVIPQMIKREQSVMKIAQIKQEIFMSETRNKMKKFLQTNNPGEVTSIS
ncbi:uncharacterized protein LOC128990484 isoform X2 [Macrosteles quadrilineatus]|uniref:uncharacterized protein LOC128990484 isoform X2 n=1 Tax=Macrosteles quadrilineatus TaxID=74068 RepID=UPI0023E249F9|nr:uncharacterized protein LOC128990484 isoform X2 [Macrosteles quadrilineatus]